MPGLNKGGVSDSLKKCYKINIFLRKLVSLDKNHYFWKKISKGNNLKLFTEALNDHEKTFVCCNGSIGCNYRLRK